jgi:hypothetical protein
MKNKITLCAALIASSMIPLRSAQAADVDSIFVRVKAGPTFYSNFDPITSTLGTGLDLGYRAQSGFGLAASAKFNLNESEQISSGTATSKSLVFGVEPNYSVTKGIATLSFGVGVGVLSSTSDLNPNSGSDTTSTTNSRSALMPDVEADLDIGAGAFVNVSVQYVASFGTPHPSFVSPMAGIGYRF